MVGGAPNYTARWNQIRDVVRDRLPEINELSGLTVDADSVRRGEYRVMTLTAPYITIYLEPGDFLSRESGAASATRATCTIFCGVAAQDSGEPTDTVAKAVELALAVMKVLLKHVPLVLTDNPVKIDTVLDDIAVVALEFLVTFNK